MLVAREFALGQADDLLTLRRNVRQAEQDCLQVSDLSTRTGLPVKSALARATAPPREETDRVALNNGDLLLAASPIEYERVDQLARETRVQVRRREDVVVVFVRRAAGRCDTRGGRERSALERAMCSDRKLVRLSNGHIRSVFAERGMRTEAKEERESKTGPVQGPAVEPLPFPLLRTSGAAG